MSNIEVTGVYIVLYSLPIYNQITSSTKKLNKAYRNYIDKVYIKQSKRKGKTWPTHTNTIAGCINT